MTPVSAPVSEAEIQQRIQAAVDRAVEVKTAAMAKKLDTAEPTLLQAAETFDYNKRRMSGVRTAAYVLPEADRKAIEAGNDALRGDVALSLSPLGAQSPEKIKISSNVATAPITVTHIPQGMLANLERTFDIRLFDPALKEPFDSLGDGTRGLYLAGYGTIFTTQLSLIVTPGDSPFPPWRNQRAFETAGSRSQGSTVAEVTGSDEGACENHGPYAAPHAGR